MKKDKKEVVLGLLKKDTDGLTILEIANKLKISRNTAAVVLAELRGAQAVRIREIGRCKLHYINEEVVKK